MISTHTASQQQIAGRASEQRGYSRTEPKPVLSLDTKAGDLPLDTNSTVLPKAGNIHCVWKRGCACGQREQHSAIQPWISVSLMKSIGENES